MKVCSELGLNLDDVVLIAEKPSIVDSRDNVKVDLSRIIHAPMPSNQHVDFLKTSVQLGTSVVINRFNKPQEQKELASLCYASRSSFKTNSRLWIAVGLKDWQERCEANKAAILTDNIGICVDVANSHSLQVQDVLKSICEKYPDIKNTHRLMTGNVNSREGFEFSQKYAGIIRVGIGQGAACSTASRTGFSSQGNFSTLKEIYELSSRNADIIFDGGLKNSGDFAKAFLGGANWCMSGGYFSKAVETYSDEFYGGASIRAKELTGSKADYIEGKVLQVKEKKVPLSELIKEINDGLASAVSYAGYASLVSAIGQGTFQRLK